MYEEAVIYMKIRPDSELPWDKLRELSLDGRRRHLIGRFYTKKEVSATDSLNLSYIDAAGYDNLYADLPMIAAVDAAKLQGFAWFKPGRYGQLIHDLDHAYDAPDTEALEKFDYVAGRENRFLHCTTAEAALRLGTWFIDRVRPLMEQFCVRELRYVDSRIYFAVLSDVIDWNGIGNTAEKQSQYDISDQICRSMFPNVDPDRVLPGLRLYMLPYKAYHRFLSLYCQSVALLRARENEPTQYQEDHEIYQKKTPYTGWTSAFQGACTGAQTYSWPLTMEFDRMAQEELEELDVEYNYVSPAVQNKPCSIQ